MCKKSDSLPFVPDLHEHRLSARSSLVFLPNVSQFQIKGLYRIIVFTHRSFVFPEFIVSLGDPLWIASLGELVCVSQSPRRCLQSLICFLDFFRHLSFFSLVWRVCTLHISSPLSGHSGLRIFFHLAYNLLHSYLKPWLSRGVHFFCLSCRIRAVRCALVGQVFFWVCALLAYGECLFVCFLVPY